MEKAIKEMRISELRALQDESDDMIIEGYAAVFEQETDLGWCKEIISRDAFNDCNMSDCVFKYNHNDNCLILARTRNKSLELLTEERRFHQKCRHTYLSSFSELTVQEIQRAAEVDLDLP